MQYWLTPILTSALPGMANGFSIFLLKGFFDSLPQELDETADIDGATEWHEFWIITMSLSKPITDRLADELSDLKFGCPNLLQLPNGDVFATFWCHEDEISVIRWVRIRCY